jgi:Tol biopolymer transport system component/basic membrane lipoprotein Med (substrate-binding protein (PBP1-ABC) superfamily)/tRNA A-37 threonylcarbamoyl transferase component Bud32
MTPQTIDRYEVHEQLGRGGMATVYHAYDPHFGRDVAIKVLPREFLHDPTFRARFEREVKAIARLEHSAIVPVHDFGEHEGQPFLVMRYLPGGSLADRIKAGPLSLDETIATLERVGAALDSAHRRGVIHRDVKPGNILFDDHGDAYLSDFGIVKLSEATAQLTGSGIIGTPAYMAPEMADPGGMSPSIDVYALGVTLYEILTGRLPFDADTPVGVLMAHMNKPVPDVRLARPDLPESVQAVIERAMAKDPSERYQSAGDLAADLRAAVAAPGEATPETTPVPLPSKAGAAAPARRRGIPGWVWAVGGVGALLVVGLVAGVLMIGSLAGRLFGTPEPGEEAARSEKPAATEESVIGSTKAPADIPASTVVPPTPILTGGGGGAKIAFSSERDGNWEIYVMDADGSNQTRLTDNPALDDDPDWSPDGTRIVFASERDGNWEIYVMDADGSNQTRLTTSAEGDYGPAWSPDGARIVFMSERDGNWDIYVMDADGSNPVRLTDDPAWDGQPVWSPDGERLAFSSQRDDNAAIYLMDADGSNQTRLTVGAADDYGPVWSPDGERIAFTSERDGNWEIYVMDADGSNQTRLTDNPASDNVSDWSPDGARITFISDRPAGDYEVYTMDADGSNLIRLTYNSANEWAPAWQPPVSQARVAVVLDIGGENDRGFNEYTLKGAREAAEELGLGFAYAASGATSDYEGYIEGFADEGYNLIITVGYLMADATAAAAVEHPDVHFVIIDVEYDSGSCPVEEGQEVEDCYAEVLTNVTSLTFAEDEAGYLAGMLAGCMTETGVVGSVAGAEIPPVVRYVTGFQTGARNANPGIAALNVYIPDFTDFDAGYLAGMEQIAEGADIIFGVGGVTGNGGLLAAYDVGVMVIGVDVDQYYSYPEVSPSLLTSATKNMDVAVGEAIRLFAASQLEAGVRLATVANGGVGLAPYHDWEDAIPLECKMLVDHAYEGLVNGTIVTGY